MELNIPEHNLKKMKKEKNKFSLVGYQLSALFNASTDTFVSAMIAHLNAQVKRLGIQLTKVCISF